MLNTSWVESDAGPPRQYYQLTAAGTKRLTKFTAQWRALGVAVESLLQEHAPRLDPRLSVALTDRGNGHRVAGLRVDQGTDEEV